MSVKQTIWAGSLAALAIAALSQTAFGDEPAEGDYAISKGSHDYNEPQSALVIFKSRAIPPVLSATIVDDNRTGMTCQLSLIRYPTADSENAQRLRGCFVPLGGGGFERLLIGKLIQNDSISPFCESRIPAYEPSDCDFTTQRCVCFEVKYCQGQDACLALEPSNPPGASPTAGPEDTEGPPEEGTGIGSSY